MTMRLPTLAARPTRALLPVMGFVELDTTSIFLGHREDRHA
jgi:hypothetical protein